MATEQNPPSYPLPTYSSARDQHDAEAAHPVRDVQTPDDPPRPTWYSRFATPTLSWWYISIVILDLAILIMTSMAIDGLSAKSNIYDQYGWDPILLYTSFASTKYLLFVSIWTIFPTLFYIFCSQPVFRNKAPDYEWCEWTRFFEWPRLPKSFTNTFIAHLLTWIFWFAGAVAQTAWLDEGYWCIGNRCKSLKTSALLYDGFVAAFAYLQVILWSYPTFTALWNFFSQLSKQNPHRPTRPTS